MCKLVLGFDLISYISSPWFFGARHGMAGPIVAAQADREHISTDQIYANVTTTKEVVACKEPRPQVCTQDYRPVCALLQDGSFKTFSNGCNACSDPAVTGYREGACE